MAEWRCNKRSAQGLRRKIALCACAVAAAAGCDDRAPLDDDEVRRILHPASSQADGGSAGNAASAEEAVPPPPSGIVAPEAWEMTCRIYRELEKNASNDALVPYTEQLSAWGTGVDMAAVRGGEFEMGSPDTEPMRRDDEAPRRRVRVDDFWMSTVEIPWEVYIAFMDNGRPRTRGGVLLDRHPDDELWDLVAQPTAPYTSMNLGMGNGYEKGMPAISMSHYAASKFCEWLSAQTGRYYRLPTEAEWEYACRGGSAAAYCYGNDEAPLGEYAWFWNNANDRYQHVALKKPNAFGLFDMHGNVAEWVLDTYAPYPEPKDGAAVSENPLTLVPGKNGHVVRGGSWEDDPDRLRSAARRCSGAEWAALDPQNPKSLWYLTNGGMIGFRIVRPAKLPDCKTMHTLWNASKGTW